MESVGKTAKNVTHKGKTTVHTRLRWEKKDCRYTWRPGKGEGGCLGIAEAKTLP